MKDRPESAQPSHYCGRVSYDGTNYFGFQVQPDVPTIQGELESALARIAQSASRVTGAGRTDTGVHATGQVVGVSLHWRHSTQALQQAWNANLPADVTVDNVQVVPDGFHPRYSATARVYRYTVVDDKVCDGQVPAKRKPLVERFAWFVPERLNLTWMQEASKHLLGTHDFGTFGQPPQGKITVRTIDLADWQIVESSLNPVRGMSSRKLVFTIQANAFLRQMVRNIVGTLVDVGAGRATPDGVCEALQAVDRARSGKPAPPQGLVFEKVHYPDKLGLCL